MREDVTDTELRTALDTVTADAEVADTRLPMGRTVFTSARAVRAYKAVHDVDVLDVRPTLARIAAEATADRAPTTGVHPSTKAALQVALATAVATGVGEWISSSRWYWAVLTAFVVFTGTTSRGDILTRAWQRVLGTLVGVVAGVLLAALVGQDSRIQLGLVVVCVFAAFYLVSLSSTVFVFFFTVLLAMLYGLLGTFSIGVLELRLAETAAGAAVGIVAAFLVLPTRTRATVTDKLDGYLGKLDGVVVHSVGEMLAPTGKCPLISMSRELDTALGELTTAAAATPDPAVATVLRQAGEEVRGHIAQLQSMLHGAQVTPARSALPDLRLVLDAQPPGPPNRHARLLRSTVFALVRIDRAVLLLLPSEVG